MSNSNDDVRTGPRIVSRRRDRREADAAPAAPAGAETTDLYPHIYEVTQIPPDCTDYQIGDRIELYVAEPPQTPIIVHVPGTCDGMIAILFE